MAALDALIRSGKGDIPPVRLKWRCGNCRFSAMTDFVVSGAHLGPGNRQGSVGTHEHPQDDHCNGGQRHDDQEPDDHLERSPVAHPVPQPRRLTFGRRRGEVSGP
jgi:hypothetical protein